jgi:hypothetical protein
MRPRGKTQLLVLAVTLVFAAGFSSMPAAAIPPKIADIPFGAGINYQGGSADTASYIRSLAGWYGLVRIAEWDIEAWVDKGVFGPVDCNTGAATDITAGTNALQQTDAWTLILLNSQCHRCDPGWLESNFPRFARAAAEFSAQRGYKRIIFEIYNEPLNAERCQAPSIEQYARFANVSAAQIKDVNGLHPWAWTDRGKI